MAQQTRITKLCLGAATFLLLSGLCLSSDVCNQRSSDDPVFLLFTRKNPTQAQTLELGNSAQLNQSNFDIYLPTKMYAHGWVGSPEAQGWGIRDGYLRTEDCNFIAIDWSVLAQGDFAEVATKNVPIVGSITARFIDSLVEHGASLDSFHLIGFSMGSHVVGVTGSLVTKGKLPRITGVDPSINVFGELDASGRLDATDAVFVDAIHTNRSLVPVGHVDFYPNGGVSQPGCPDPDPTNCCHHCRAVYLMAESITSTVGFRSLECASYENFQNGACGGNNVALMGDPVSPTTRGYYYLNTNANSPYAQG